MNTTKMTTHTSVIRIRLPIVLPLMSLSLSASRRTRSTARGPSRPASPRGACRIERGAASMPLGRSRARGRRRAASSSRRQGLQPLSMHLLAVSLLGRLAAVRGFVHPRQTFALFRQPQSHQRAAWPQTRRWIRTNVQQGATAIVGLFVHDIGKNGGKAQPLTTGASWQSGSKLEFGPSRSASRRAEHFLVALLPSNRLFLSAKHLLFEVNRTSDCAKTVSHAHDARTREAPGGTGGEAEIVIPSSGASLRLRGIGSPRERAANMAGPRWQRMCPLLCHR